MLETAGLVTFFALPYHAPFNAPLSFRPTPVVGIPALDAEGFLLIFEDYAARAADLTSGWSILALAADDPQPTSTIGQILNNPLTPIVGLFLLFYFIFIMPERRRKAEEAQRMSSLKKNDRIVTIGGIHGMIVAAPQDSKIITIKIDEAGNTRVKINRSAIAAVVSDKGDESSATASTELASETKKN